MAWQFSSWGERYTSLGRHYVPGRFVDDTGHDQITQFKFLSEPTQARLDAAADTAAAALNKPMAASEAEQLRAEMAALRSRNNARRLEMLGVTNNSGLTATVKVNQLRDMLSVEVT
ncbi:MAG: hypothetical protein M3349_04130 [Actinomycetota bacterium]|nr:hypothetical protein [Actinomycetota bacterium]